MQSPYPTAANMAYYTNMRLVRLIIPNRMDDVLYLCIKPIIHEFENGHEQILVLDFPMFNQVLDVFPAFDKEHIKIGMSEFLSSQESYYDYKFRMYDEILEIKNEFYFVVCSDLSFIPDFELDFFAIEIQNNPVTLLNIVKSNHVSEITINKPIDNLVQPIRDFARLYQVYEKFIQDGYDELFAKEICGLSNPVVFNLLKALHEAAQCDLNYLSDRDKIFRRYQNQKYVQGSFFDKQAFCHDHDISVEDLEDVLNEKAGEDSGYRNRLVI
ncbi:MAG: hypothetical protein ACOVK9_06200 [Bacteroidia bacterium]